MENDWSFKKNIYMLCGDVDNESIVFYNKQFVVQPIVVLS